MKPVVSDVNLVAYCGLYCGACGAYRRGRCPGCHENRKATWCKVRACCMDEHFSSCAECRTFSDQKDCKKYNNIIARIFGWIFRSDRRACICQIREKGLPAHADRMTAIESPSIRR
jgi:hypothetical protein